MNPHPPEEFLSAYVDGELSSVELADVERLLSESPDARATVEKIRSLGDALRNVPEDLPSDDLSHRVLRQAERESLLGKPAIVGPFPAEARSIFRRRRSVAALVSCVGFLAIAALTLWSRTAPRDEMLVTDSNSRNVEMASRGPVDRHSEFVEAERMTEADFDRSPSINGTTLSAVPDRMVLERDAMSRDSALPFLSATDLKDAKIGDVISGWKLEDQDVVVVELTVVDRRQVFDSLQILLSDLNIRNEPPRNEIGQRRSSESNPEDDILAVYVEADQSRMETALAELQANMDIASIEVSTVIPTQDLDPILLSNGYQAVTATLGDSIAEPGTRSPPPEIQPSEEAKPSAVSETTDPFKRNLSLELREQNLPPPPPLAEPSEGAVLATRNLNRQRAVRFQQAESAQILGENSLAQQQSSRFRTQALEQSNRAAPIEAPRSADNPEAHKALLAKSRSPQTTTTRPINLLFIVVPREAVNESSASPRG